MPCDCKKLIYPKGRFLVEIDMKFAFKSIVAAAAFVAAGAASAASLTLTNAAGATPSVSDQGWNVSGLTGSGALTFSKGLLTALNAAGAAVTGIDPANFVTTVNTRQAYTLIKADAPVTSLSGSFDGTSVSVSSVQTAGGAHIVTEDDGLSNTGGFLDIQNLRVELSGATATVYADINGGNGVGVVNGLKMWNATLGGATTFAAQEGTIGSVNTLTGLVITSEAFTLFAKATGLNATVGTPALASVTDFGTIASTISVTAKKLPSTGLVPEPSTYALMGLGLIGMSVVARRRAK